MRTVDATLVLAAGDLSNHACCVHLTTLSRRALVGELKRPHFHDPTRDQLRTRGLEHEQRYLALLRSRGRIVESVDVSYEQLGGRNGIKRAMEATLDILRRGHDVYQGVLSDGQHWLGRPDFLLRTSGESALGDFSFEVADTKLARHAKVPALLQVCMYSELLARLQDRRPEFVTLVLGGPVPLEEWMRLDDLAAYVRLVRTRFEGAAFASANAETYPDPVEHCSVCDWRPFCTKRLRDDDHLSFVAGLTSGQRRVLVAAGVPTLTALAADTLPAIGAKRIGRSTLDRLRQQAWLQHRRRVEGKVFYEILPHPEPERGLAKIPPRSQGDLFLDLEGAPFAGDDGINYLFGVLSFDSTGTETYQSIWAPTPVEERHAFEHTVDLISARVAAFPGCHVYHFGDYEQTAFKKMAGRHNTRADELDALLRGRVFVNLHRVMTQGVRASVESYSIKDLEDLYAFHREIPLADARRARDVVERDIEAAEGHATDVSTRNVVEGYNRDDCVSTLRLRDWLEQRRTEYASINGTELPRPAPGSDAPPDNARQWSEKAAPIAERLLAGIPDDATAQTPEEHARWLLAQLLGFHDREQKPVWWEYFRLAEMSEEELLDERLPLTGLELIDESPGTGRHSEAIISHYRYPPQDHCIEVDSRPIDPSRGDIGEACGTITQIDDAAGEIWIRRSPDDAHASTLIARKIIPVEGLKDALLRLATRVLDSGFPEVGPLAAASDLLLARPPRVGQSPGADLVQGLVRANDAVELVGRLQDTVLAVQGPPGSGKTWTGARMVAALLARGKRVGVTGPNHKAIRNFVDEVVKAALEASISVQVLQKTDDGDSPGTDHITVVKQNPPADKAIASGKFNVIAGTAWLFARPQLASTVDVLFVDEAGQVSLANVLAASGAATSIVLLGDPQQLDQPLKATHPPGTDGSALQHMLGAARTLPPQRGLFLGETWRLHPDIARFTSEVFYESRLQSHPGLDGQAIESTGMLRGSGLRFCPVSHVANRNGSPEEVAVVGDLIADLLDKQAQWVDAKGNRQRVRPEDILVVAPYNVQVAAIARIVPPGVRVGTVDRFQGREAPLVIYSMATSSVEDAPRGMEFLFSLNRLNVATSRARCLAVVVSSPALLAPDCRHPRQVVLANALCRFVEMADTSPAVAAPAPQT